MKVERKIKNTTHTHTQIRVKLPFSNFYPEKHEWWWEWHLPVWIEPWWTLSGGCSVLHPTLGSWSATPSMDQPWWRHGHCSSRGGVGVSSVTSDCTIVHWGCDIRRLNIREWTVEGVFMRSCKLPLGFVILHFHRSEDLWVFNIDFLCIVGVREVSPDCGESFCNMLNNMWVSAWL